MAQVTTGPTTKKTFHLARDLAISVAVIIAVAAFFAGWYGGSYHKTKSQSSQSSSLLTYKDQKNGFQFMYPKNWGNPRFTKTDADGSTYYALSFAKPPSGNLQYTVSIVMSKGNNTSNSDGVKKVIKNKKSSLAINDDSSYAIVASLPNSQVNSLSATQIVSLNKIGITAATMNYTIMGGSANCPQNKFSTDTSGSCVTKADYDTVNQVLKSIKSL
jgi:hypothetical protein